MIESPVRTTIRPSAERGYADHGWLKSFHSFSFADYFDREHVEFGALRVINDDRIAGGSGFGMHGHKNMEILTYVLEGQLEHKDSLGTGSVITHGDVQRMSAGTGVLHSEFNPDPNVATHLLQIWITPNVQGIAPSYEEKNFAPELKRGRLCLIASADGRRESVHIQQDAAIYAGCFDGLETATYTVEDSRRAYIHVARGSVQIDGRSLAAGDALMVSSAGQIEINGGNSAEILLFDLA